MLCRSVERVLSLPSQPVIDASGLQSAMKRYRDELKPSSKQTQSCMTAGNTVNGGVDESANEGSGYAQAPAHELNVVKTQLSQQIDYDHMFDDEDDILAELDLLDPVVTADADDSAAIALRPGSKDALDDREDDEEDEAMFREMHG